MSARVTFAGLEELGADLRNLTPALAAHARAIVENAAEEAKSSIFQAYPRRTGNLRRGVTVTHKSTKLRAVSVVTNRAPHAWIYENGTQARHTKIGANRGSMPPGHVFWPIYYRRKRKMLQELADMARAAGFDVVVTDAA